MKILVTGGAGFIGSCFARNAVYVLGWDIWVLDALTYCGNLANLECLEGNAKYKFIKGDIRDTALIDKLLREIKPDVIVNFAAESHVDRSIIDAAPFISTNVLGTQTLLDAVRRSKEPIRYVQISTDEVYGSVGYNEPAFTEQNPLKPSSPYAASKASADLLALAWYHTYGLDIIITRCSNNYGPYHFPEKLIPLAITNLLEGKKVPVYGDGLQVRDWIHVSDHVTGIITAILRGKSGHIYNFGGGNGIPNLDVVEMLLEMTGRDGSFIEYVKDRPGHDRVYLINHDKATAQLEWRPTTDFESGLSDLVQWYKNNRKWWTEIKSGEYRDYYTKQYGDKAGDSNAPAG
jgi:dTDP-glucose 4,6-dehydratase